MIRHIMKTRICNKCNVEKSVTEFYNDYRLKEGRPVQCISCKKAQALKRTKENPVLSESKICSGCKVDLPISEFHKDSRQRSGTTSRCKKCTIAYKKDYYHHQGGKQVVVKHREGNREKIKEYGKKYREKNRNSPFKNKRKLEFCLYKGGCCTECGFKATEKTIPAFDFHHVNPSEKEYTPSDLLMSEKSKVLKELDKCILLCSNCHRILHFNENRQYRAKPMDNLLEGVETIEKQNNSD